MSDAEEPIKVTLHRTGPETWSWCEPGGVEVEVMGVRGGFVIVVDGDPAGVAATFEDARLFVERAANEGWDTP